jgi:anti-sigma factor RsiW
MSVDLEGARCEEEAARLLPWYLTGRLSAVDMERVTSHLQHCAICRADLEHERSVQGLVKADSRIEYAPQAGLAKVLSRIDEFGRDVPNAVAPAIRRRWGPVQWLTAAVLVQALALGWLGTLLHDRQPSAGTAPYQTLSADPAPVSGAHIRVVFAPAMTLGELKSLLAAHGLTIIRGPSDAGAYTLAATAATPGGVEPLVTSLRTDARVLFVEAAVNDAAGSR